jgi:predicted MFS family arabinose efflux permease
MRAGFLALVVGYALSQFYRAFLAVLAPLLEADIGADAEDLAFASGAWFAAFAAMQLPVGHALDRIGPRRTAGGLLLAAVAGAAVFALAQRPETVTVAMALIGIGCAPVLMAAFYIFARAYPPAVFASLGGLLIGVSSAGNVASAAPMAWAAEAFGWRACLWALAGVSFATALAILAFVRDPARLAAPSGHAEPASFGALLRSPALLLVLPLTLVHYAPVGGVRGLWAGPYLADVFGLDAIAIGNVTLAMGAAMIAGTFAYGPLDRLLGTRKGVLLAGNLALAAALLALAARPAAGLAPAVVLLCAVGFFGASFPLMVAHGRSFFPAHLAGRGVTFLNLLAVGGAGIAQLASGRLHAAVHAAAPASPAAPYAAIFLLFGLMVAAGCLPYAFARDRLD